MRSLTVKTHSETRRESEFFEAILTLAGSVLTHDWRIVEHDPADVVIISFDSVEPYSAWDEYSEKYPSERLVAYTDETAVRGAKWYLRRNAGSMPRLSEVVKVLNNVADYFSELDALPPAGGPSPPAAAVFGGGRFDPSRHLAGTVREAVEQGLCRVCSMAGCPPVYLFPRQNAVYTAADSQALSALCRADIGRIQTADLPEEALLEAVAAAGLAKRRPLSEFLWFSILTGSNGRMLAGCQEDEAVHLREWPGHARLSFYAMYRDIAMQMAAGMGRPGEIARQSAAPLQNVVDFHNACAYFGLIARGEEGRRLAAQKAQAREYLRAALRPCRPLNGYLKLVLVGSVGSGKTTALTTLSETPPILTEANPSDTVAALKSTTTVAMEYGEVRLGGGSKLQIYGTPGQKRFDFMGQILCARAWGLLILIDNSAGEPLAELKYYIDHYAQMFSDAQIAVGVSHYDAADNPAIEDYENFLAGCGRRCHVGVVDARDGHSLALLVAAVAARPGAERPRHVLQ